jgi:hypothetical protein
MTVTPYDDPTGDEEPTPVEPEDDEELVLVPDTDDAEDRLAAAIRELRDAAHAEMALAGRGAWWDPH